jgi:DNA processing protein
MKTADDLDQRRALFVLNGLPNIGPVTLKHLLDSFENDAVAILNATRKELIRVKGVSDVIADTIAHWRERFDLEREETLLEKHGASNVNFQEADYPPMLKEIYDPPICLYFLGDYRISQPAIAIVGTRRPTLYGRGVAKRLARELAQIGFCIVSGLARGIDSEAHEGALEAKGKTVAVLGCGLDIIYPPENLDLYRRIASSGAIVSEFPFGRRADKQSFPMRNRVISGICLATIVVESNVNGGSMITARFTGEQGRMIFAVPGHIDQASSQGYHQLLRDGATLLNSTDDVIEELRLSGQLELTYAGSGDNETVTKNALPELDVLESKIAHCFDDGSAHYADAIAELTQLSQSDVASGLMMLELKRVLAKRADGAFEKFH